MVEIKLYTLFFQKALSILHIKYSPWFKIFMFQEAAQLSPCDKSQQIPQSSCLICGDFRSFGLGVETTKTNWSQP